MSPPENFEIELPISIEGDNNATQSPPSKAARVDHLDTTRLLYPGTLLNSPTNHFS
jgi:hypothetical protein